MYGGKFGGVALVGGASAQETQNREEM